jgi:hypothetical protein
VGNVPAKHNDALLVRFEQFRSVIHSMDKLWLVRAMADHFTELVRVAVPCEWQSEWNQKNDAAMFPHSWVDRRENVTDCHNFDEENVIDTNTSHLIFSNDKTLHLLF